MGGTLDFHTAKALLEWQVELGATEAILDAPVNRYDSPAAAPAVPVGAAARPPSQPPPPEVVDPAGVARAAAEAASDLDGLRAAMAAFDLCELKRGARNLVFADGDPAARVMIIGESPGVEEDRQGRPFVGRAGRLLDAMFDAIGMARTSAEAGTGLYITNVLPWRPPQNRDPSAEEIGMMLPFLERHVALAAPQVVVAMGNISCQALLGRRGITRLRGRWDVAWGRPLLPMFHPAYLLRNPHAKRDAWADLLMLRAWLRQAS